jgi:hypothetical protein
MQGFISRIREIFHGSKDSPVKTVLLSIAISVVAVLLALLLYHYWWVVLLVGGGFLWVWHESKEAEAAQKAKQARRNDGMSEWIAYVMGRSMGAIAPNCGLTVSAGYGLVRVEPIGGGIFRVLYARLRAHRLSPTECGRLQRVLQTLINHTAAEQIGAYQEALFACPLYVTRIEANNTHLAVFVLPIDSPNAAKMAENYEKQRRAQEAMQSGAYSTTHGVGTGDDGE